MEKSILCIDPIGKIYIELLSVMQGENIKFIKVEDLQHAMKALDETTFSLVIWTMFLEDEKIFNDIQSLKKYKDTPTIIISNYNNSRYVVKSIKSGVSDYIIRPFDEKKLKNKIIDITGFVDKVNNIDISYNKNIILSLNSCLSVHIKGSMRGKYEVLAYLLALRNSNKQNNEKIFNTITKLLRGKLRETDYIINLENDNILIILPYTSKENLEFVHKKIKSTLSESKILNKIAKGAILSYSCEMLTENYLNKEDLLLKKLQSKLEICMAFYDYDN